MSRPGRAPAAGAGCGWERRPRVRRATAARCSGPPAGARVHSGQPAGVWVPGVTGRAPAPGRQAPPFPLPGAEARRAPATTPDAARAGRVPSSARHGSGFAGAEAPAGAFPLVEPAPRGGDQAWWSRRTAPGHGPPPRRFPRAAGGRPARRATVARPGDPPEPPEFVRAHLVPGPGQRDHRTAGPNPAPGRGPAPCRHPPAPVPPPEDAARPPARPAGRVSWPG